MEIDCDGLDIQITQTESESENGRVPALCANIPIKDMKHGLEHRIKHIDQPVKLQNPGIIHKRDYQHGRCPQCQPHNLLACQVF